MKIIWSDFASSMLLEIFRYYKAVSSENTALKIKASIFSATKILSKHPHSGQMEETLSSLGEGHRYVVEGNYKIIYKEVEQGILITDVFDTRQHPSTMNKKRK